MLPLTVRFVTPYVSPTTPPNKPTVWAISVSLAATKEVAFAFSSCGYLDVSVPHVRSACLCIQHAVIRESRDQRSFDSFPRLFAAFHALHRLLAPRHPPHALVYLAKMIKCQFTLRYTETKALASVSALGYVYRCHLDFVRLSKIVHRLEQLDCWLPAGRGVYQ